MPAAVSKLPTPQSDRRELKSVHLVDAVSLGPKAQVKNFWQRDTDHLDELYAENGVVVMAKAPYETLIPFENVKEMQR